MADYEYPHEKNCMLKLYRHYITWCNNIYYSWQEDYNSDLARRKIFLGLTNMCWSLLKYVAYIIQYL